MIRNADTRAARQRSEEEIPAQDHSSYNSPRLCTALPRGFRARRNRHRAKYKAPHAGADSLKGLRCPIRRTLCTQSNTVNENGCRCEGYGPPFRVIPSVEAVVTCSSAPLDTSNL